MGFGLVFYGEPVKHNVTTEPQQPSRPRCLLNGLLPITFPGCSPRHPDKSCLQKEEKENQMLQVAVVSNWWDKPGPCQPGRNECGERMLGWGGRTGQNQHHLEKVLRKHICLRGFVVGFGLGWLFFGGFVWCLVVFFFYYLFIFSFL